MLIHAQSVCLAPLVAAPAVPTRTSVKCLPSAAHRGSHRDHTENLWCFTLLRTLPPVLTRRGTRGLSLQRKARAPSCKGAALPARTRDHEPLQQPGPSDNNKDGNLTGLTDSLLPTVPPSHPPPSRSPTHPPPSRSPVPHPPRPPLRPSEPPPGL